MSEGNALPAVPPQRFAFGHEKNATPILFSLSDRVGRLRYFTYTLVVLVACGMSLIPIYLVSLLLPNELGKLISTTSFILVKNVMIPMVVFVMSIRRLHDLDFNGWWALVILIPFTTLILLALPGQNHLNRFGPPPPPNSDSLRLTAVLLPTAVMGLYFFMVTINAAMKPANAPAAVTGKAQQPLRSYNPR